MAHRLRKITRRRGTASMTTTAGRTRATMETTANLANIMEDSLAMAVVTTTGEEAVATGEGDIVARLAVDATTTLLGAPVVAMVAIDDFSSICNDISVF